MTEKIVWIGGYPFVKGVNAPTANGGIKKEEIKPVPAPAVRPATPTISHDLRAGQVTSVKRAPTS